MQIGTKIRINKGKSEILIKKDNIFGLFKSKNYQIVRNIQLILHREMLKKE